MTTVFQDYVQRAIRGIPDGKIIAADEILGAIADNVIGWLPERYDEAVRHDTWRDALGDVIDRYSDDAVHYMSDAADIWAEYGFPEESESLIFEEMGPRGIIRECARQALSEDVSRVFWVVEDAIADYEEDHVV